MNDLKLKGRITEILEGGKVLRQDIFTELKSVGFGVSARKFYGILKEMLEDGTVRRIIVENKKVNRIEEYWELNE